MSINFTQEAFLSYEVLRGLSQHGLDLAKKLHELAPSHETISFPAQYLYHAATMIQENNQKVRAMILEAANVDKRAL